MMKEKILARDFNDESDRWTMGDGVPRPRLKQRSEGWSLASPEILLHEPADSGGFHAGSSQLVYFILEYIEVVRSCHGNDVVLRMPGSVEDFLVEV